jgi:hypothetical protein
MGSSRSPAGVTACEIRPPTVLRPTTPPSPRTSQNQPFRPPGQSPRPALRNGRKTSPSWTTIPTPALVNRRASKDRRINNSRKESSRHTPCAVFRTRSVRTTMENTTLIDSPVLTIINPNNPGCLNYARSWLVLIRPVTTGEPVTAGAVRGRLFLSRKPRKGRWPVRPRSCGR